MKNIACWLRKTVPSDFTQIKDFNDENGNISVDADICGLLKFIQFFPIGIGSFAWTDSGAREWIFVCDKFHEVSTRMEYLV